MLELNAISTVKDWQPDASPHAYDLWPVIEHTYDFISVFGQVFVINFFLHNVIGTTVFFLTHKNMIGINAIPPQPLFGVLPVFFSPTGNQVDGVTLTGQGVTNDVHMIMQGVMIHFSHELPPVGLLTAIDVLLPMGSVSQCSIYVEDNYKSIFHFAS
jgi:hypothetical protein